MSETTTTSRGRDEQQTVALSSISVAEEFNPRKHFDERDLARLADSIRTRGLRQPLLVAETSDPGAYLLVAGERRYRACLAAGLTEVPVLVRGGGAADVEQLLADAIVENLHRADLTAVEEAIGFQRLLDAGFTRKGVCEELSVTAQRVRERLELLKLSAELHPAIDTGEIPLAAVPALVKLAAIDPELPGCAYRRVKQTPERSWERPLEWADVVADPIGAVTCRYNGDTPQLPGGIYEAGASYPLAAFTLSEKARRDLDRLAELDPVWAGEGPEVMFTWEMVEHARTLGAAHLSPHGRDALIVGDHVADELVARVISRQLRDARAHAKRAHSQYPAVTGSANGAANSGDEVAIAQEQARQAERDAQRQARLDAETYNDRLGGAVFKTLSTVKIDQRVIKVLAAVDLNGELDGIAMRGARYGFPDWVTLETTKTGKTKRSYLERPQATAKARDYLAGAQRPGEIAGRCLALIAMAVLADEKCVARSNRSGHDLYRYRTSPYAYDNGSSSGLAWAREVVDLVEEICVEQLPATVTERLRERRERQQAERAQADSEDRAAQSAYDELAPPLADLDPRARKAAITAYAEQHPAADFLLEQLQTRHDELLELEAGRTADTVEPQPDEAA